MGINVPFWNPSLGDQKLTAALLAQISGNGNVGAFTSTNLTTVGNGVLTAAGLVGGQIVRSGPVAAFTDTTATAAQIITALGGFVSGMTFQTRIKNTTIYNQTLAGGTGVTMSAATLVPALTVGTYNVAIGGTSASPTVTFTRLDSVPIRSSNSWNNPIAGALSTVGAGTITAAIMNGGVITRSGTQVAAFTDTTDTALLLIAGIASIANNDGASFEVTYVNNTIFPATIAGGSGVTITGQTVVPANSWIKYLVTRTSSTAVTMLATSQGYFPKSGTVVANGATPVAVTDAAVTAGSIITLTLKTTGGTAHGAFVSAVTAGTGFSINSLAGDTGTYNYEIRG